MLKTPEVMHRLKMSHDPQKWAFFEELRIGTGFGKDSEQRLDAWAIHYHPSKRNVSICYEVKVSKSDFKKEITTPIKRRAGLRLSNEFYFVTPKGLCKIEDIPLECGLIEVDDKGVMETIIAAPFRDVHPPTWLFVASISRRMDKPRLEEFLHFLSEDGKLEMYSAAVVATLKEHIERWKNFSQGNKEIPDKIADALAAVLNDSLDVVEQNRKIK